LFARRFLALRSSHRLQSHTMPNMIAIPITSVPTCTPPIVSFRISMFLTSDARRPVHKCVKVSDHRRLDSRGTRRDFPSSSPLYRGLKPKRGCPNDEDRFHRGGSCSSADVPGPWAARNLHSSFSLAQSL